MDRAEQTFEAVRAILAAAEGGTAAEIRAVMAKVAEMTKAAYEAERAEIHGNIIERRKADRRQRFGG